MPIELRGVAKIDLDLAENNFNVVKNIIPGSKRLFCVVKSNAYGHGAVQLSRLYSDLGASHLCVACLDEALELRAAGISLSILVLGYTPPRQACVLAAADISQCVFSEEYARALSYYACGVGPVKAHIKIDTGMCRLGFSHTDGGYEAIRRTLGLSGIVFEGIFTHFASADRGEAGREFTLLQISRFSDILNRLSSAGDFFQYVHASNSGAILDYPRAVLRENCVRAGILLYGIHPSEKTEERLPVSPVMQFFSVIAQIKTVKRGTPVGYGGGFLAKRDMRLATIPLGYADGVSARGSVSVIIKDTLCFSVGSVCMDQMTVDVTEVSASVGDRVTVMGDIHGVRAEDIASASGCIPYNVLCGISRRVTRAYFKGGKETERICYADL